MKIDIELTSEQMSRLIDAMTDTYEDLDNKIKHLKGRVKNLEIRQKELIGSVAVARTRTE